MPGAGDYIVGRFGIADNSALADFITYAAARSDSGVKCRGIAPSDFELCVFSCALDNELYTAIMKNTVEGPQLPGGPAYRLAVARGGSVALIVMINGDRAYFHVVNSPAPADEGFVEEVEVLERSDVV